ncbi:MAG: CoA-binding protein, partial [Thermodesulfobacteriota bacterium]
MSTYNLDYLLNPGSVAVIGASEKSGSIGSALMRNMLQAEFPGRLIPVNPNRSSVHGLPALP